MSKPILYFDMDNVLVDFQSGIDATPPEVLAEYDDDGKGKPHYDDIPGIFLRMVPVVGAVDAVKRLSKHFDCYILSTSPWNNPTALSDKQTWVKTYFGDVFHKRMILTHHKNLCLQPGAWLIDDREKHGAADFGDHHIHFLSERFPDWNSVVDFLMHNAHIVEDIDGFCERYGFTFHANGRGRWGKDPYWSYANSAADVGSIIEYNPQTYAAIIIVGTNCYTGTVQTVTQFKALLAAMGISPPTTMGRP